jgi:anti-anti-sigma factor
MADPQPVTPARPVVVTLPDEIDMANAGQVGEQLDSARASGAATVVADMTATRFCDSSGMQMLVRAHRKAAANNAELRVVIPSANVLRALAIMRVDTVPRIFPSLEDALAP